MILIKHSIGYSGNDFETGSNNTETGNDKLLKREINELETKHQWVPTSWVF